MFALLLISSLSTQTDISKVILTTILTIAGLVGVLFIISTFVLPKITEAIAKSQEFLLLFSVGWCFALALLFDYFGLSIEIGALLAGISLSLSPYKYEISSKLRPIRDFFLILFFIYLGSQLVFTEIMVNIVPIIAFSALILIGNPLIVMTIMGIMGYTKRNSFLAGLTVAQISEFSIILISLGISVGHINQRLLSMITLVGIITIVTCTYMILYSNSIYKLLSKYLSIFERKGDKVDAHKYHHEKAYDIILFGYNKVGYDLIQSLRALKRDFLVVDYNPDTIKNLASEGFHCRYGDCSDSELLNELALNKTKMIISSIPDLDSNLLSINKVRDKNKKTIIIVISHQIDEAMKLYEEGATYVIMPHFLGGQHASMMIENNKLSLNKFLKHKVQHIEYLKRRQNSKNISPERNKKPKRTKN